MSITIKRTTSLDGLIMPESLGGMMYMGENQAHQFVISCTKNGAATTLSGSITGRFKRADGSTVVLTGSLSNGKASLTLPQACYVKTGRFTLAIFNVASGTTTTIYAATGSIMQTQSDPIVDPGSVIPNIDDLLAEIDAMRQATAAANAAAEKAVRYDSEQSLTSAQKSRARSNIDAAPQADADAAVKYNAAQSLTDAQKTTARGNIGAASAADMTAATSLLGNTALPTTAQTVTGAIAEHETDISGINGKIGAVPYGANLQGEVDDLKSALDGYNSYDIIHRVGTFTDKTSASVTYTWNADKTQCTVNGTATGGFSSNNLYTSDVAQMPPGMVAGQTYPVLFETTNSNIKLEILHYLNGATSGGIPTIIESTTDYTVPDNCTALVIRLRVNDNTDGTGVVRKIAILSTDSNENLLSAINNLSGTTNLYKSTYVYNVQPNGSSSSAKRALSAAAKINGNGIIYVKKLPSYLHYSVCTYSGNTPSSFIAYTDNDWHEVETFIIDDSTAKYIRLYFGKKDNTAISDADLDGVEIAVYNNVVTPVYYTGDTAQDKGARAIANNMRKTITVCSWNTGLWNNGTTQYMAASNKYKWMRVFGEIDADIIMTQESPYTVVSGNTVTYPDLFGYKYDYSQNPLSSESVYLSKGIVSTFPLADPSRHYFSDNQRTYIKSYIIIDDTVICLINAHLSFETAVRSAEMSELIAVMNDEEYVIVCGDFNAEALSEFSLFTEAGYKVVNGGDFGDFVTWPHTTASWPNGAVDNCIVSSNIKIQNAKVIDGTGTDGISDHKAFVAELRIV